jgi:HAD superfamily hydrolase (TIGR01509 family)
VKLKTVFLDAGGVLLFPNWHRISDVLARHGVTVTPEALAAAEPYAKRDLDRTKTIQVTNDASRGWLFFNLILTEAGITVSYATTAALEELHVYHQRTNLWELIPDDVRPALAALRAHGLTLTVVSNANGTLREHLKRIGLAEAFDVVLDSCDEGVEKPDPRFFEIALERSGARRETTIHVGDIYEVDVVGARNAGIRGVLLDAADLYADAECPRVRTLAELVDRITRGEWD